MENSEKNIQLLEKIKAIQIKDLFQIGKQIDIHTNNYWDQGIIKDITQNNKYGIISMFKDSQFKRKQDVSLSSLSILGENTTSPENIKRARCLNKDIFQSENKELLYLLNQKIQELNIDLNKNEIYDKEEENKDTKENNNLNYKDYNLYQFLNGTFIDTLFFVSDEVEPGKKIVNL